MPLTDSMKEVLNDVWLTVKGDEETYMQYVSTHKRDTKSELFLEIYHASLAVLEKLMNNEEFYAWFEECEESYNKWKEAGKDLK